MICCSCFLFAFVFVCVQGPVRIGRLIGKNRENQKKLENAAKGEMKIKTPQRGSADDENNIVTLYGPADVVNYWGPWLQEQYKLGY